MSTAINLMAFVGAFSVQWGLGGALDLLRSMDVSMAGALRIAFGGLIVLQLASLVPLILARAPARGRGD